MGKHSIYLGNVCLDVSKARDSVGEDSGQEVVIV